MKTANIIKNQDGFTLTEILVVLVIIGILTVLAFSKFDILITKTKSLEAQTNLKTLYTMQNMYKMIHDTYSDNFAALSFDVPKLINEGGEARYKIVIESASLSEFTATATSIIDFDSDGIFNVWRVTQEGKVEEIIAD